jgi:CRISPR-associated protein Cst2
MSDIKDAKALTLTYLTPVSFASLNGSDKEADNISSIKKISVGTEQFPYVSAQAVRRALRDQLAVLGWELSEGAKSSTEKGAATTQCKPFDFIDDDLFGFMNAQKVDKGGTNKRTSAVRVSPLIALNQYQGDLDFGTNYMGVDAGGDPNIYETEIHSGLYRGTILVELDRVGCGDGFKKDADKAEKAKRVKDLLMAIKNLWTSGRQSRFLADISPKFVAAAMLRVKNPIFLESIQVDAKALNIGMLNETVKDFKGEIIDHVFGLRQGFFSATPEGAKSIGEAFDDMGAWVDKHYA